MSFKRSDLIYNDYVWTHVAGDDPRVSGPPDNTMLNRKEGYEVLYFINKCAELWNWSSMDVISRQRLEKAIRNKVPPNIRTQQGIKEWVEANFQNFWYTL